MNEQNKCVICGKFPEERLTRDREVVEIYFKDPKTKEQLCEEHNKINNFIYKSRGENSTGDLKILERR